MANLITNIRSSEVDGNIEIDRNLEIWLLVENWNEVVQILQEDESVHIFLITMLIFVFCPGQRDIFVHYAQLLQ